MKKIIKYSTFVLFILLTVLSCDLERRPFNSLASDNALETVSDAQNWDNAFMDFLRGRSRGIFDHNLEIQSDQYNATVTFGNRQGGVHFWKDFNSSDYDLKNIFAAYYRGLKNINEFIFRSKQIKPDNDDDQKLLNKYIGDAYFLRAYYYYQLAMRYGRPYDKSSASKDLSVPLVLVYDYTALPPRATNEEVYSQIKKDLDIAKKNLAPYIGSPGSEYINIDVCYAFEARLNLYMGDFPAALEAAEKVISTGRYPLVNAAGESFVDMWHRDKSTEDILTLVVKKPKELANTFFGLYSTMIDKNNPTNPYLCSPDWLPTQTVIDLFSDEDLRKSVYFEKVPMQFNDIFVNDIYLVSKFKGNKAFADVVNSDMSVWGGYRPTGQHKPKIFRVAEMYLIAAEAAYKVNDEVTSKKYLKNLMDSRKAGYIDVTGDALYKQIKEERNRELAFEGFRLFDLRRYGEGLVRTNPQKSGGNSISHLVNHPSPTNFKISKDDNKWIWGIPAAEINTNPNIKGHQNPGW